jgi:hypothetical protein
MKNIARAICVAVFLIGLMMFSLAQSSNQAQDNSYVADDIEPAHPYVEKVIQYRINKDGSKQILSMSTVYHKANGEARFIRHGPNGPKGDNPLSKHSNELYIQAVLSDGFYSKAVGSDTLRYESGRATEEMLQFYRSPKNLRNNPHFVRMGKVAGLEVYVIREEIKNPASGVEWVEESYSPKIGFSGLLKVIHFREGWELVSEVLSVEFKDVPEDLNDDLKDLPINNLEEKMRKHLKQ